MTEYVPRRITGNNDVTLSSFFHWAGDEFQIPNPMKMIPAPKFETPPVEPFRREEVEAGVKFALEAGTAADAILNQALIAAMDEVGQRFENGDFLCLKCWSLPAPCKLV